MRRFSLERGAHRCRGQVIPVVLFGLLIAGAAMTLMFNAGQKVTEKSMVANAADASAYSGAVWTARHLNFMAYTNRAMIANHVAVGHYISYTSWIRYVAKNVKLVKTYTQYIPIWGQYISAAEKVVHIINLENNQAAKVAVPVVDTLNLLYRGAQAETQASLTIVGINSLMEQTARTYDSQISVNNNSQLASLPDELRIPMQAKVAAQALQVPAFVKRYTASNDQGRINGLISSAYQSDGDNKRWIAGERGWQLTLPLVFRFRKQGSTAHSQNKDGANWGAKDRLQASPYKFGVFGSGFANYKTVGTEESASAKEFAKNYQGVPAYYNLPGTNSGAPNNASLEIAAFTAKDQGNVATRNLLNVSSPADQPLMVASLARVEFKRPVGFGFTAFSGNQQEFSNLYNPFWEAHLVAVSL